MVTCISLLILWVFVICTHYPCVQTFVFLILKTFLESHVIFIIITSTRAGRIASPFLFSWEHLMRLILSIPMCLGDLKMYSLFSSLNHPGQSKITFVWILKKILTSKIVIGKCKNIFCLLVVVHKRFLSHFSSQLEKLKSLLVTSV